MRFGETFGFPIWSDNQPWNMWFAASNPEEDRWCVVEKRDSVPMWSLFQKSMRISEWVTLEEESPVTKRLIPFKNGYFKAVPL